MFFCICVHESTITCMFPCITPVSAHFWPPLEKGPLALPGRTYHLTVSHYSGGGSCALQGSSSTPTWGGEVHVGLCHWRSAGEQLGLHHGRWNGRFAQLWVLLVGCTQLSILYSFNCPCLCVRRGCDSLPICGPISACILSATTTIHVHACTHHSLNTHTCTCT